MALEGGDPIPTSLAGLAAVAFRPALALVAFWTLGTPGALGTPRPLLALFPLLPILAGVALVALVALVPSGTAGTGNSSLDDVLDEGRRVDVLHVLVLVDVLDGHAGLEVLGDGLVVEGGSEAFLGIIFLVI